jgi:transcriptional regulator with XRE-family HTH domain
MDETDENWYSSEIATFGDRLAAAREHSGMSPQNLAKRLGVKQSTIRGWEADTNEPRANRLSMLAGLLNVSVMWLLTGEGEGVGTPRAERNVPEEIRDILIDIRTLRATLKDTTEKLSELEKRLIERLNS